MRVGAIDIGTNTILLLIAEVQSGGSIQIIRDEHAIARLGKGIDADRVMKPQAFERAVEFLLRFKTILNAEQVDSVSVTATSFLRDTKNKKEFVEYIRSRTGFEIRILTGDEEGNFTYQGAIDEFLQSENRGNFAVLDIGGGSTELSLGIGNQVLQRKSLDIGSVRLTERMLTTSPPTQKAIETARAYIREQVAAFPLLPSSARLVGVAGTLTTLAAIELELQQYDREAVSGHTLTYTTIQSIFDDLSRRSLQELTSHPQILPERADILVAGILILLVTMEYLERKEITVSDRGLRYGVLLHSLPR